MMVYDIEFYAYLPKIKIYYFLYFDFRSDPDSDPWKKMSDPHPWSKSINRKDIQARKENGDIF